MMALIKKVYHRLFPVAVEPYPYVITLDEMTRPTHFNVHSDGEKFRVKEYGGEYNFMRIVLDQVQADDVVYDIGASIGLFTLLIAQKVAQVIAFEPDTEIRERLNSNIKLNAMTSVDVLPYAVSDANDTLTLYTNGADNVSPSLKGDNVAHVAMGTIAVEARTLDSLVSERQMALPTIIKIDIEGAEIQAVRGAKDLLRGAFGKRPRKLFIEVHPEFLPDYGVSVDDLVQFMTECGYNLSDDAVRDGQRHHIYTLTV